MHNKNPTFITKKYVKNNLQHLHQILQVKITYTDLAVSFHLEPRQGNCMQ